jgi:hypothetical protein
VETITRPDHAACRKPIRDADVAAIGLIGRRPAFVVQKASSQA